MEDKIKILYILTKSDLGGVQKYLLEIITHLSENIEPYFVMPFPKYFSEVSKKSQYNLFFNENRFIYPGRQLWIKS